MNTRVLFLALLASIGALAVVGCGSDDDGGGDSAAGGAAERMTIGYSNPNASGVPLQSIAYGQKQAIEKLDLPWTVNEVDAKLSGDKQVADIDTMIVQRVGAVTSWTMNPGAAEQVYRRAQEAGIPVMTFNSESESATTVLKTQTDATCDVSVEQAEYIAERVPNAKVLMVGGPEAPSIIFTTQCFRDAAKEAGLKVIGTVTDTQGNETGGQKVAADGLTRHGSDVQAIWVYSDPPAAGVAAAVQDAGMKVWSEEDPTGVVFVSRDGASTAVADIKAGRMTATWDGNMSQMGAASIQLLKQHYVDGVPLEELPKEVLIEAVRYDQANADEYDDLMTRDVQLPLE
jgi:ribose transport system substrate-binding protein